MDKYRVDLGNVIRSVSLMLTVVEFIYGLLFLSRQVWDFAGHDRAVIASVKGTEEEKFIHLPTSLFE